MERHPLNLTVNGKPYAVETEFRKTLADTLREDCGLTGTHVGCEHGVCGACTVVVEGKAVRSCLMFAHQAEGMEIETVESLEKEGELHVLQEAFAEHHALQCGFCTPGFLMLVKGAVERGEELSDAELRHLLSSNLCRCTGYQNIIRAVRAAIDTFKEKASAVPEAAR
ncbi:(2Fe-2S)-binding protein [Pseudohoeflea coraliihabitans]|uniref:(2Fe-2S)-binding protein n=1 Tax=Pseudohoeflea coraliihabitans TaxID=2860393 RepID=A0ABS6WMW9_9HYPH|nr:(2Fe-2S)-binding protein [Pseudohoeflea sp. DP4N28-3]MBW3097240.1 (2Fe-2S)-binding protein [Pseudohoeflea sp. DP4N28-3]